MARIEAHHLSKRFGDILAVDDLSFSAEQGRVTGFLGPNGAGKTTTLRMLLGLVAPTAGEVLVDGLPYHRLRNPSRTVGAVLEATGFHPGRTARHHLTIVATSAGMPTARVGEVLEAVGLADAADRRVGGFSMGMRQRLELARALLGDPEVLVLDEPASGLDPQGIAWLRGFLRWFASQGRVVLISSHLLAEAAQTVDDVIVLTAGRLAGQGPLATLLTGARTTVRVRTPHSERLLAALAAAGITARREGTDRVVADGTSAEAVGRVMAEARIVVLEMASSGETLEELFFSLTEGSAMPGPSAPGVATAMTGARP